MSVGDLISKLSSFGNSPVVLKSWADNEMWSTPHEVQVMKVQAGEMFDTPDSPGKVCVVLKA